MTNTKIIIRHRTSFVRPKRKIRSARIDLNNLRLFKNWGMTILRPRVVLLIRGSLPLRANRVRSIRHQRNHLRINNLLMKGTLLNRRVFFSMAKRLRFFKEGRRGLSATMPERNISRQVSNTTGFWITTRTRNRIIGTPLFPPSNR